MKNRSILYFLFISISTLVMSACVGDPEFPSEPIIEFESISKVPIPFDPTNPNENGDSIKIAVKFQDQEGDLGFGEQDLDNPLFAPNNPDGSENKFHFNYFMTVFKRGPEDTTFTEVEFDSTENYNGRFPRLNTSGQDQPLEGILRNEFVILVNLTGSPIQKGDSLKFEVQIADRQLNLSNVVMTDAVFLFGRLDEFQAE